MAVKINTGRALVLALLTALTAHAGVSLMTGNYFVSFRDLLPRPSKLALERVYNSKTSYDGWFGVGWGTSYETRIVVEKDGSLTLDEFGGGASATFFPSVIPSDSLEEAVDRLVATAKSTGDVTTPIDGDDFRREVARNFRTRERKWSEYASRKLVEAADPAKGRLFRTPEHFREIVVRTADGFRRTYETGKEDRFDREGRLIETITDGATIRIDRSDPAKIQIAASTGKPLNLEFAAGHVARITEDGALLASYEYNQKGELIMSRSEEGSVVEFQYDSAGMTRITTDGQVTSRISYYPAAKFHSVKSYEGPELIAEYDYDFSRHEQGITVSFLTAHAPDEPTVVVKRKNEYFKREGASGNSYLYRTIETVTDGRYDRVTITDYNELGVPTLLRKDGKEQRLAYDSWGRVVRKETDDRLTELVFDPSAKRVASVREVSKNTHRVRWSRFTYDERRELKSATDWRGRSIVITADPVTHKISDITNELGSRVHFSYDALGKMEWADMIRQDRSVRVPMNQGRIKDDATADVKAAAKEVAGLMSELAAMIKLAGIKLAFEE